MARLKIVRNKPRIKIVRTPRYYSIHTHSRFSANDALPEVKEIVDEAKRLGYRGLGLTDHGNMAGSVQLYMECKKAGIKPFPGSEIYLVKDRGDKKSKRYHAGLLAYTTQGYRNLVQISTRSHRQFHHKPLLDLADLADLSDQGMTQGIALTTGCFFGLVITTLINEGYEAAKQVVATLASWFDTYVEIQAHCIDHGEGVMSEEEIADALYRIAQELDLPVVVTQDSHYTKPDDKPIHEALKRLVSFGDGEDAVFPGDGFHMVDDRWMQDHHAPHILQAGLAGLDLLIRKHTLAIPEMDEYNYRVPVTAGDPLLSVRERVGARAGQLGLGRKYEARVDEELEVVEASRMAGYMALVARVCDHMRDVEMFYQCRGSAAGSAVCWLLDITNVDPIRWKLRFDRFLSKDRTKPPDIDIDIESDRRQELLSWINTEFHSVQIGLYSTYSLNGEEGESSKGSLRVKFLGRKRRDTGSADWSSITREEYAQLKSLDDRKLISGYGVHPAGVIICSSREELESTYPMMWVANSKTMVSQYDGIDVERIGGLKLDVLGVKTLAVLRRTLVNMGRSPKEGLDWIPMSDAKSFAMIAKGDTGGVFQLEGGTARTRIKTLKPSKIADVIAAMALYRPGVMASGAMDSYHLRKHRMEKVPQRHKIIMDATNETHGILLYQDQVIEILRALGMGADDLTAFLKAVKASNKNVHSAADVMAHYSPIVRQMCVDAGMDKNDVAWLWEALEAFAEYSFNRAHATVYGITAYRCAYLANHHPVEFHAALLAVAASSSDATKEKGYIGVTRRRGVHIGKPTVNHSQATYAVDPNGRGVRRGLLSIKGIGPKAAHEIAPKAPFKDLDDFMDRVNPRIVTGVAGYKKDQQFNVGVLEVLHESGALDCIIGGK